MPSFETPHPIAVSIELSVGDVRVQAGERAETIVDVRPTNAGKRDDVAAAEQTRVEYAGGRLLVKAPKNWRRYSPFSDSGSVDVRIELPAGSQLSGGADLAALHVSGPLGDCRFTTGLGDLHVDEVGALALRSGAGEISANHAAGDAEVSTGTGAVRLGTVDGAVIVKNSNGDTWVGDAGGEVRVNSANGSIAIDRAHAGAVVKTANGSIRLGEVARGAVVVETSRGELAVGIAEGTAAWLDLDTRFGRVRSGIDAGEPPAAGDQAVEVRARTSFGDITIHRTSPG